MRSDESRHDKVVWRSEHAAERTLRLELTTGTGLDDRPAFDDQGSVGDERLVGKRDHRVANHQVP